GRDDVGDRAPALLGLEATLGIRLGALARDHHGRDHGHHDGQEHERDHELDEREAGAGGARTDLRTGQHGHWVYFRKYETSCTVSLRTKVHDTYTVTSFMSEKLPAWVATTQRRVNVPSSWRERVSPDAVGCVPSVRLASLHERRRSCSIFCCARSAA